MMRVKQAEVVLKLYMKMKETRHVQHLFNMNSPQQHKKGDEMDVTTLLMISLLHFQVVKANDQCRKWQTYSLDIYADALENSELLGHAFHAFAKIKPIQCYSWYVDD